MFYFYKLLIYIYNIIDRFNLVDIVTHMQKILNQAHQRQPNGPYQRWNVNIRQQKHWVSSWALSYFVGYHFSYGTSQVRYVAPIATRRRWLSIFYSGLVISTRQWIQSFMHTSIANFVKHSKKRYATWFAAVLDCVVSNSNVPMPSVSVVRIVRQWMSA